MSDNDAHFRLRIPRDLKEWVDEAASKSHRSINAQIVHLIERAKEEAEFFGNISDEADIYPEDAEEIISEEERVRHASEILTNNDLVRLLTDRLLGRR